MNLEVKRYDYIDALRGYAILGVLFTHSMQTVMPISPALKLFRNYGIYGVQLFYVVSAFALFMSWNFRSPHEFSPTRNFFIRRFFRIAPMFYLAIGLYLLDYGWAPRYWAPNGVEGWFVISTALFAHGLHPETVNSIVPGDWSIAAEMCFYLILPLLFRYIENFKAALGFLVLSLMVYMISQSLIDAVFAGAYPQNQQYLITSFKEKNFLGQLPVFAAGILAYFLARDIGRNRRVAAIGSILLGAMVLLFVLFPKAPLLHNHLSVGGMLALFAFVLSCFPAKIIANRVSSWIGRISYSMYLTQFLVIDALDASGLSRHLSKGDLNWAIYFLLLITGTVAVSLIAYHCIEQPGIRLGRRIIAKWELKDERRAVQAVA